MTVIATGVTEATEASAGGAGLLTIIHVETTKTLIPQVDIIESGREKKSIALDVTTAIGAEIEHRAELTMTGPLEEIATCLMTEEGAAAAAAVEVLEEETVAFVKIEMSLRRKLKPKVARAVLLQKSESPHLI